MAQAEQEISALAGRNATVALSQAYYLDITGAARTRVLPSPPWHVFEHSPFHHRYHRRYGGRCADVQSQRLCHRMGNATESVQSAAQKITTLATRMASPKR